jgi:RHS repeat-associated protein
MTMPGRKYTSNSEYRYGFNGKEKLSEITNDDYDYGARIYDARIGRWLSVDPLQKKYPNWTPYAYAMNSTLKLKDIDGKDVGVTIIGNTISFSSTVFVTGPGASDIAGKANTAFNTLNTSALTGRTYTTAEGKCYEVQFQVHFVSVDPKNPKDPNYETYQQTLKAKVGTNGNNIIETENKGSDNLMTFTKGGEKIRSNAGHGANSAYNTKQVSIGKSPYGVDQVKDVENVTNSTGNMAYVYNEAKGETAVHETFHLFGLGDRYIESVPVLYNIYGINKKLFTGTKLLNQSWHQKGFENDLMKNNSMTNFSQTHIDNFAKAALDKKAATGSSTFVIGQNVDSSNMSNGIPCPDHCDNKSITPIKN